MDLKWDKVHEFMKDADPITAYSVDGQWKSGTRSIEPVAKGVNKLTGNNWLQKQNEEDQGSIDKTIERSLGGFAIYMGASEGFGGGDSGTLGVTGDNGAFLGEGTTSGIGSWDAAYANAGAGGFNWQDYAQNGQGGQQQQQPEREEEKDKYEITLPDQAMAPEQTMSARYAMLSDKNTKVRGGGRRGIQRAIARGLTGADPVDENGVQVMQIQALARRLQKLEKAIAAAKAKRKGAH